MGVAIGRAVTTSGLRILNFNQKAASTKHPDLVYEFYERQFMDLRDDLLCCNQRPLSLQSSEEYLALIDQTFEENLPGPSKLKITAEFPQLEAPWNIHDFVYEMGNVPYIVNIPKDFFSSSLMLDHINFLYFKIKEIINDQPKSPQQWTQSFTKLNSFVLSDQHLMSVEKLFQQCVTNMENKLSTKLAYWLMDKEIEKRARDIVQKQKMEAEQLEITSTLSTVAKGKIRYLAGACIQRVNKRIKESVLRLVGKCGNKSRTLRKLNYKKQAMLKSFRVSEQDVDTSEDTMNEIQYKQGPSHGLAIVSEPVYYFFL